MSRDSMLVYRSFYEAGKNLKSADRLKLYDAIFLYGMDLQEPELQGIVSTLFGLIKPNIEANIKKYKNGSKTKTKQNKSKIEANDKQDESKREGNVDVNVDVNENEDEDDNVDANERKNEQADKQSTVRKKIQFVPPTVDEETDIQKFEEFRKLYPGIKKGLQTEYTNFCKHKDHKQVINLLLGSINKQIHWAAEIKKVRGTEPFWKHLQTWINNRCWEEEVELPQVVKEDPAYRPKYNEDDQGTIGYSPLSWQP